MRVVPFDAHRLRPHCCGLLPAALILHAEHGRRAREPLNAQAAIGWPGRRPPLTRPKLYRPRLAQFAPLAQPPGSKTACPRRLIRTRSRNNRTLQLYDDRVNTLYRTPASTQHIVDNVDNKGLTPARTGSIRRVGASPQDRFSAIFGEKVRLASLSPHRHSPRAQSLRLFPGENGAPRMLEQIKQFLLHYFTWWNGANFNTRFYTRRFGVLVGHDEFGNAYYRRPGIDPALGFERRWVIYNGVSEASMTPPGWNGWLHHTVDVAADRGRLQVPSLGKAAYGKPDRHAGRDSARRLDAEGRSTPAHRGRLRGLEPRPLRRAAFIPPPFSSKAPPWTSFAWPTRSDVAPIPQSRR